MNGRVRTSIGFSIDQSGPGIKSLISVEKPEPHLSISLTKLDSAV
ncbi:hypothetical protein [Paenibacillus larvae]|nr:hypothetical protein [Paenibacillus larvae]MEC0185361.1 hypothetical protein [Paenibacillus larvae]